MPFTKLASVTLLKRAIQFPGRTLTDTISITSLLSPSFLRPHSASSSIPQLSVILKHNHCSQVSIRDSQNFILSSHLTSYDIQKIEAIWADLLKFMLRRNLHAATGLLTSFFQVGCPSSSSSPTFLPRSYAFRSLKSCFSPPCLLPFYFSFFLFLIA